MLSMGLTADLKKAIRQDGRSMYALAKDAGTTPIQLWLFIDGKRGLNVKTLDGLCDALGLTLQPKRKGNKR